MSDDTQDPFCSRCGQKNPDAAAVAEVDAFDERVQKAVTKTRESIAQQCANQARERFVAVGEIRRMRGLSHPRTRRVRGSEIQAGWLITEWHSRNDGVGLRRWDIVVEAENDCGYIHVIGLDPVDGRSSYAAGYGANQHYWIDDFSIEVATRSEECR